MYERFTDRARKVMQLANDEARRFQHEYVGTEHILLGLVREGSGVAANVLKNLNVELRSIRLEVEKIVLSGPDPLEAVGKLPLTPRAKKVIEYAIEEARHLHHNYIGTEHLLLGLLREEEGVASVILGILGLNLDVLREETLRLLGDNSSFPPASPLGPLFFMPQENTSDLPAEVRQSIDELNAQIKLLNGQKESAVAQQDFELAAYLRDRADKLKNQKRKLLREWHLRYVVDPSWLAWNDATVAKVAYAISTEKHWEDLPILADALEEAGCTNREMLNHCREARPHEHCCWVVNLLRGAATATLPPP